MTTYELLERTINNKKASGTLTAVYIASVKKKMDVFLVADRLSEDEYNTLLQLME